MCYRVRCSGAAHNVTPRPSRSKQLDFAAPSRCTPVYHAKSPEMDHIPYEILGAILSFVVALVSRRMNEKRLRQGIYSISTSSINFVATKTIRAVCRRWRNWGVEHAFRHVHVRSLRPIDRWFDCSSYSGTCGHDGLSALF